MRTLVLTLLISFSVKASINIDGSRIFHNNVLEALSFLEQNHNNYYNFVNHYVDLIKEMPRSGTSFEDKSIHLNLDSCINKKWCSAVFIHEAVHFWQFETGRYNRQASVENEAEGNIHMLEFLRVVGGDEAEIEYLSRLIKSGVDHSDLNEDGRYDELDYQLRNY